MQNQVDKVGLLIYDIIEDIVRINPIFNLPYNTATEKLSRIAFTLLASPGKNWHFE